METAAQEREVVQLMQGSQQAWPFHMMAAADTTTGCSLDACTTNYSSNSTSCVTGDCFMLGWEQPPPLGCFGGFFAADVHELFPLRTCVACRFVARTFWIGDLIGLLPCAVADMESSSLLPVVPSPTGDMVVAPQDLDELLLVRTCVTIHRAPRQAKPVLLQCCSFRLNWTEKKTPITR
jgi:hypothetical protein